MIELIVTVSIIAILIALASPSLTAMINRNRLSGQANEMVAALQTARMEAVKRNARVALCKTADGATCSAAAGAWTRWLVVVARNGEVLRSGTVKAPLQVTSTVATITFRADGLAHTATGGMLTNTITVCIPTTQPAQNRRGVVVGTGSRISSDQPSNGNGACPA